MLPRARRTGLTLASTDDLLVVRDEEAGLEHEVDALEATVWQLADGEHAVAALATAAEAELGVTVTVDEVWDVLDTLGDAGLLDERVAPPAEGMRISRRRLLRTALIASGGVAAAAVATTRPAKQQEQIQKRGSRPEQRHKTQMAAGRQQEQVSKHAGGRHEQRAKA